MTLATKIAKGQALSVKSIMTRKLLISRIRGTAGIFSLGRLEHEAWQLWKKRILFKKSNLPISNTKHWKQAWNLKGPLEKCEKTSPNPPILRVFNLLVFKDVSPSKRPSVSDGCPTWAQCARIWCWRPVKIRIPSKLTVPEVLVKCWSTWTWKRGGNVERLDGLETSTIQASNLVGYHSAIKKKLEKSMKIKHAA